MYKKIALIICLLQAPNVFAEIERLENKPSAAIGANFGWIEANGLSYRRYFNDQYVQFTFAGIYNKDEQQEYFDASISHAKYLTVIDNGNFFPIALKIVSGIEAERDGDRTNDLVDSKNKNSANELHVGTGFGVDIGNPLRKGLGFSAATTYTASFRSFKRMEFAQLGLLPTASIYYNY